MRSRADLRWWRTPLAVELAMLLCLFLAVLTPAAHAQEEQFAEPSAQEIAAAIDLLKADSNLNGQRTIRVLKWVNEAERPPDEPNWLRKLLRWLVQFFTWLTEAGRWLFLVLAVALIAMLVVWISRFMRSGAGVRPPERFTAPTHVQDLDIRPESLPEDIGAAARALWDRGQQRVALALLYRGLLSRLAHVHAVPIRDSTTEGDCLSLARQHLSVERAQFVSQLVRVWTRSVYGGIDAERDTVYALCDGFAAALNESGSASASFDSAIAERPA